MITAFFATAACNRFNHLFRIQRQHFLLFKLNKITGRPVQNSAFAFFVRLSVFFSPHRQNPKPFAAKRKNKRIFQAFCLYRIVLSDFSFCKQYPVIMIHRIIRLSIPAPCKVNAICQSIWITPLLRKSCIHHNSCFFFAINSFHFFCSFSLPRIYLIRILLHISGRACSCHSRHPMSDFFILRFFVPQVL